MGDTVEYLSISLDVHLDFSIHFVLDPRVVYLDRLLPNTSSTDYCMRQLYINVFQSMLVYGTPTWSFYLK